MLSVPSCTALLWLQYPRKVAQGHLRHAGARVFFTELWACSFPLGYGSVRARELRGPRVNGLDVYAAALNLGFPVEG